MNQRNDAVRKVIRVCCAALPAMTFAACGTGSIPTLPLIGAGDGDNGVPDDVPYCELVSEWEETWVDFEQEVLALVNDHRAAGANCGGSEFGSAGPLVMNGALRCAARNHSLDMAVRGYFDHYSPEGDGPGQRFDDAGYTGSSWGENIAWGYGDPQSVVAGWMNSPGHCSNIMNPNFTETGVGYYSGSLWTQAFGRP